MDESTGAGHWLHLVELKGLQGVSEDSTLAVESEQTIHGRTRSMQKAGDSTGNQLSAENAKEIQLYIHVSASIHNLTSEMPEGSVPTVNLCSQKDIDTRH